MVFTPWHYLPSAFSALLIFFLAWRIRAHKRLGFVMAVFAVLGLAGYIFQGNFRFYPWDFHVMHSWLGLIALLLSLSLFLDGAVTHSLCGKDHCRLGYVAAAFALFALLSGLFLLLRMGTGGRDDGIPVVFACKIKLSAECVQHLAGGRGQYVSGKKTDAVGPAGK